MNSRFLFTIGIGLLCLCSPIHAQLSWRVSVKVFTSAGGNRPVDRTDAQIQDDYDYYNKLLAIHARGYQFQLTEVVQLPSTLSSWFSIPARNAANRDALQATATADAASRALYAYRDNAINVYINNSASGICCGAGNGLIFIGREDGHITPLHEIGHLLGLPHTQGYGCNGCCPDVNCCDAPGNDGLPDTILDLPCWDRNQIAENNFPAYPNLTEAQWAQVDDVWLNIMSYHYGFFNNCRERLTSDQLDLLTDVSNGSRFNVATGRTWFVDRANSCLQPAGGSGCTIFDFGGPLPSVTGGINAATAGDIVLIRSGNYNERTTFTKPVTLRATRGVVSVGLP